MTTTDDFLADYEQLLRDAARRRIAGTRSPSRGRSAPLVPFRARGVMAVVLGAVTVGLLVVAGASVLSGAAPKPAELGKPVPDRRAQTGTAAAGSMTLGVLRRERKSGDAIPRDRVSEMLDDPALASTGIEWSDSRRATIQHGFTVYVVPAREEVCMVAVSARTGSSLACGGAKGAVRNALAVRIGLDDRTAVAGLVPDGIPRVSIISGTNSVAPVEQNGFVALIGGDDREIRLSDSTGSHSAALPPSPIRSP